MERNVREAVVYRNGYKFAIKLYEHSFIGIWYRKYLQIICLNPPYSIDNLVYNDTYPLCDKWWDRMSEAKSQIDIWCRYADNVKNEQIEFDKAQKTGVLS